MATKWVYKFSEGNAEMRNLLGGKGANLAEMTGLNLPIPQGFTVTTEACTNYYDCGGKISDEVASQVIEAMKDLEEIQGKKFGDLEDPLLVSVRSGARVSMPGMMDTILNLGLNDEAVEGFAKKTGNPRFAYDSYRRFIQMFSDVVKEVDKAKFEDVLDDIKAEKGVKFDTDLDADDLKEVIKRYKGIYRKALNEEFPQDPKDQLFEAIKAVFRSWDNPRAIYYRRMNDIPGDWGTAVNVQTMVFGNMGDTSGTGVAFTRNPSTGEKQIYGEYLINAQGEDVVAGVRTPQPITKLAEDLPECYKQFMDIAHTLEEHYRDMQDMEFTIQEGKLYFLQTRNGKRTAPAALRIACELVDEGKITKEEAVSRIDAKALDQLLHPNFDQAALKAALPIGEALPASPGAAAGKVYFDAEMAKLHHEAGLKVILVRLETSPEDIEGMHAAEGILTARGGMTSHAAVVARGMGKCCVSGAGSINVDYKTKTVEIEGVVYKEGDYISLNGTTGQVYAGQIETKAAELSGDFKELMDLCDKYTKMEIRTNADTPHDAKVARQFGAKGIGLTRTEHMFFDDQKIVAMREMILADSVEGREKALAKLLPYQKADFYGILKAMDGCHVNIRLLDPPLHEFVPHDKAGQETMAKEMGVSVTEIKKRVNSLAENNPMLGHRGCRLGITFPEITAMQTRAILGAACQLKKEGFKPRPEIMVPLIGTVQELKQQKSIILATSKEVFAEYGVEVEFEIGTMIEIPRAALTAGKIAEEAQYFSFGTNDLTQMTFGYSRDDIASFLPAYMEKKILKVDPFQVLDQEGVGQLIKMAVENGRATRPNLRTGICGEHGGEPSSVKFCAKVGMNYASCSPFRVPIARLAAAQAAVEE